MDKTSATTECVESERFHFTKDELNTISMVLGLVMMVILFVGWPKLITINYYK